MNTINIAASFAAGVLSLFSPCVFPLLPVYFSFLGGNNGGGKGRLVFSALLFIAGFSAVFIVLSILSAGIFFLLSGARQIINIVSGAVVILFGLHKLFGFLPFLNREKRAAPLEKPRSLAGAFVFGAAFGAGWTPCVGPVLSSILLLAAGENSVPKAALLLACYSAGLGLPFFLIALLGEKFSRFRGRFAKLLPALNIASGVLIVAVGVLILSGSLSLLNGLFSPAL